MLLPPGPRHPCQFCLVPGYESVVGLDYWNASYWIDLSASIWIRNDRFLDRCVGYLLLALFEMLMCRKRRGGWYSLAVLFDQSSIITIYWYVCTTTTNPLSQYNANGTSYQDPKPNHYR